MTKRVRCLLDDGDFRRGKANDISQNGLIAALKRTVDLFGREQLVQRVETSMVDRFNTWKANITGLPRNQHHDTSPKSMNLKL